MYPREIYPYMRTFKEHAYARTVNEYLTRAFCFCIRNKRKKPLMKTRKVLKIQNPEIRSNSPESKATNSKCLP